jgi:hypothetical protein
VSLLAALLFGAADYRDAVPEVDCARIVALRDAAADEAAFAKLLSEGGGPRVSPLYCTVSGWGEWWCTGNLLPDGVRRDSLAAALSACLPGSEVSVGEGKDYRVAPTTIRSGPLLVIVEQGGSPRAHVGVSAEVVFVPAASNRRTP